MAEKFKQIITKIMPGLYSLAGPFIIAFCWYWYHLVSAQRGTQFFWWRTFLMFGAIFILFFIFKALFRFLVAKFNWHTFWLREFTSYLDELFFLGSLSFFIFFFTREILSLIYILVLFGVIFLRLDSILSKHKEDLSWRKVNRAIFMLSGLLFIVLAFFQYAAYYYFIFDSNIKYANIVLFRVFSLTLFWLGSFAFCSLIYFSFKKRKQLFLFFWLIFFWTILFFNLANTATVYEAGLYLSPIIFSHLSLTGLELYFLPVIIAFVAYFLLIFFSWLVFRKVLSAHQETTPRHWLFYNFALLAIATFACFSVNSLRNTPEAIVIKNFYDYFRQIREDSTLPEGIQKKLENFGLFYDQTKFAVLETDKPGEDKKLDWSLSSGEKPNLLIIYLESFSARLTGPYNKQYVEVTPGLNNFVADKNTTLFRKVYNASTPTITGLLSSLCSFLPPTGHEEIEREKKLKSHRLVCLPEILKQNGYQQTSFITAVDKEFSNKNTILESMGIDKVWGTQELSKDIAEDPKSWGYSDHQLFPIVFAKMSEEKKEVPFLMIYETVDTHPPFNLPQDIVPYKDGTNPVLNALHTTDDAFGDFWDKFKNSDFYNNTAVLIVADHAIFPIAYEKKYFPEFYGKTTFYDELFFALYMPENNLPKEVDVYGSGIDLAPTVLHFLNIKAPDKFEGHSLLGNRSRYPNIVGMHEFGLYLNQKISNNNRQENFAVPGELDCDNDLVADTLSLCELKTYYDWKRDMLLSGRLW